MSAIGVTGNTLPLPVKLGIERLSGLSMDGVRVHYNSDLPAQIGAAAYTQGSNIFVAPGQARYLPHEAWHVVQQIEGRVPPIFQVKNLSFNDDLGLEREADRMGIQALHISERDQGCPLFTETLACTPGLLTEKFCTEERHLDHEALSENVPDFGRMGIKYFSKINETAKLNKSSNQVMPRTIQMVKSMPLSSALKSKSLSGLSALPRPAFEKDIKELFKTKHNIDLDDQGLDLDQDEKFHIAHKASFHKIRSYVHNYIHENGDEDVDGEKLKIITDSLFTKNEYNLENMRKIREELIKLVEKNGPVESWAFDIIDKSNDLLKILNNAPDNLKMGLADINISIGTMFDPNFKQSTQKTNRKKQPINRAMTPRSDAIFEAFDDELYQNKTSNPFDRNNSGILQPRSKKIKKVYREELENKYDSIKKKMEKKNKKTIKKTGKKRRGRRGY